MEVRPGYKLTEVGLIPEDWEVAPVASKGEVVTGKALAIHGPGARRPYLRTKNVFDGKIEVDDVLSMPMTDAQFEQFGLLYGDVLLNEGQSLELVGRCAMYKGEYPAPCAIQNALLRFRPKPGTSGVFASYVFRFCQQSGVFARVALQTTSIAHLGGSRFQKLSLAWPGEKREQDDIAAVLNDMDALLDGLERLITKKRDIRQGAMQQLLTGQIRLPGFVDRWKPKSFGDLLRYERPDKYIVANSDYSDSGDVPVLTANKSFVLGCTDERSGICQDLPVVLFDDFTTDSKYVDFPFKVKSSAIKLLRPLNPKSNLKYIFARMHLFSFPRGEHKRYYISEYQHVEFPTPEPDEQAAIVTALSDMDAEIVILDHRLSKTRNLKQGMMQQLLTGKIRLVRPEESRA